MAKKKIVGFVFLFLFMFSLAFVSSTIYKKDNSIDLKINTNLTGCNLTVSYPNTTNLFYQQLMQNNKGYENYTFYVSENGVYQYFSECGVGNFEVTPTGEELTQSQSSLIITFLIIFVFLFLVTMGAITFLEDQRFSTSEDGTLLDKGMLAYVKPILYVVAYALLLATMFLSSNVALAYLSSVMFGTILFTIYRVMFILALPLFILWIIFIFVRIFDDKKTKSMFERGLGQGDL